MSFRMTWVPAVGTIFTVIACSLFRADAQTPVPPVPNVHDLMPFESTRSGQTPVTLSQSNQSAFHAPGTIGFAAIPGAHSYALFSGAEFNMFYNNEEWITSQLDKMGGKYVLEGLELEGFEPVPPLESVVTALQVTGRNPRMAFFDEDDTKPAATSTGTPPVPPTGKVVDNKADDDKASKAAASDSKGKNKKKKAVVRRDGRLVLNIGVNYRGWHKKAPNADDESDESDEKDADDKSKSDDEDAGTTTPAPAVVIPPVEPSDLP